LKALTGDIVLLGGYRGSVLRDTAPPHRRLWVPVKVGLGLRKANLELGLHPDDELNAERTIFASGMLQNIGPVDMSKRLFKKLRECENARSGKLRVHDYGYDWRLSPVISSRKLIEFLETLPSNQARLPDEPGGVFVIAHSLGGIITRHAVNRRPELFSGVVYAGTPQRCINILGPVRNNDAVLINKDLLTPRVTLSLRSTFVFLPEDGFCFIDKETKENYAVDFFDVNDWIRYRWSPCVDPPLPAASKRASAFGSLFELPASLSNLPLRDRSASEPKRGQLPLRSPVGTVTQLPRSLKDRTLAPQMDSGSSHGLEPSDGNNQGAAPPPQPSSDTRSEVIAYLTRTLAETKAFRSELSHKPSYTEANTYPPLAVVYGRGTPTVHAARVASRDAIACADAYDDLAFRSGDGVVLAREAMLPPGYDVVRGGLVCTDRGHVTLLGDLGAVAKAIDAVIRGRRKGIGLGKMESRERRGSLPTQMGKSQVVRREEAAQP